jgi:hypothetical protein
MTIRPSLLAAIGTRPIGFSVVTASAVIATLSAVT